MAKLSLDDRLNQIEDKISEKSFRENKGLGNERQLIYLIFIQIMIKTIAYCLMIRLKIYVLQLNAN